MYTLESVSRRYAPLLPTESGPQYFADIMKYLSTAVKTMCENEKSAFKVRPDWRQKPFFQLRLGPTRPSLPHREAPTSESGASGSQTNPKPKGPGYTVSYFGEQFHERTIPPTNSLRQSARYVMGLGVERDLHPEHAAFIELIAHGLYCEISSTERGFMDLERMTRRLSECDYVTKGKIWLLGSQLEALELTSKSKQWRTGYWPTAITVRVPPLSSALFRSNGPSDNTERKAMDVTYELDLGRGNTRRSSSWTQNTLPSSSLQNPGGYSRTW